MKSVFSFFLLATAIVIPLVCRADNMQYREIAGDWQNLPRSSITDSFRETAGLELRRWLRAQFVGEDDLRGYGLVLDSGRNLATAKKPLVVLLHGFNSTIDETTSLLTPVRNAGYPCATFAYPNDYALRPSARLLARQLRQLSSAFPNVRVALLCYSMGGLVARECVENPALDPGNVKRLILVAPPNGGTMLANIAVGTDLWEHWIMRHRDGPWTSPWTRLHSSIADGLGEAKLELRPGSKFLQQLNSRGRNPNVQYSILLGSAGIITEDEMLGFRQSLVRTIGRVPGARTCTKELDLLLAELDEVIAGKGDGAVAISRGRLKGVKDIGVLPFGHLQVTHSKTAPAMRQLYTVIRTRLDEPSYSRNVP